MYTLQGVVGSKTISLSIFGQRETFANALKCKLCSLNKSVARRVLKIFGDAETMDKVMRIIRIQSSIIVELHWVILIIKL